MEYFIFILWLGGLTGSFGRFLTKTICQLVRKHIFPVHLYLSFFKLFVAPSWALFLVSGLMDPDDSSLVCFFASEKCAVDWGNGSVGKVPATQA